METFIYEGFFCDFNQLLIKPLKEFALLRASIVHIHPQKSSAGFSISYNGNIKAVKLNPVQFSFA